MIGATFIYFLVVTVLATLIQFSLFSWPLFLVLSGSMLTIAAWMRHTRITDWANRPLLFEDEPIQVQVLGLR